MKIKFLSILLLNLFVQSSYGAFLPIARQLVQPPLPIRPGPGPVAPAPLQAPPVVELGTPTFAGTGCPQGTVGAVLSPDKSTLSILFDRFMVEAGPSHGKTFDIKNCALKIPMITPNGRYSAQVVAVEYRGALSLPQNSSLQIVLQDAIFSVRGTGLIMNRERFVGPLDQDFLITVNAPVSRPSSPVGAGGGHIWSVCNQRQELNLNARMELQNNSGQDALAAMDSIDLNGKASVDYKISWRNCLR